MKIWPKPERNIETRKIHSLIRVLCFKRQKEREAEKNKKKDKKANVGNQGRDQFPPVPEPIGPSDARYVNLQDEKLPTTAEGKILHATVSGDNKVVLVISKDGVTEEYPASDYKGLLEEKYGRGAINKIAKSLGLPDQL